MIIWGWQAYTAVLRDLKIQNFWKPAAGDKETSRYFGVLQN
jgi:hypothetical protein